MIASHQSGTVLTAVKTASRPPSAVACATFRPVLTAAARGALANSRSGRGNGASIEQRNWLLGPGSTDRLSSIGKRDSHDWRESENHAQTAHRRAADDPSPTPDATPGPAPGGAPAATSAAGAAPPATTATLGGGGSDTDPLQDQYRAWLDNLPASLGGSTLAEKLQAIAELDLEELQTIDPPRGYGRD